MSQWPVAVEWLLHTSMPCPVGNFCCLLRPGGWGKQLKWTLGWRSLGYIQATSTTMPSAGAGLWISLETHQCYKWSVAGSRLKESNFLKIAWAESWGHGEVLLFSNMFLLWSSLYLWEIGSYIIFDVKSNWRLWPATHPCLRQKICPGNVDNLAKLGHWAAFLAGRKVRPVTRDGCGWNPYMPLLLWQCLCASITKTWQKGPSVGLAGQAGDRCLCCVTQLGMSTPPTWGCCFPILVYYFSCSLGFFSPL